jgi:hypothetical protein
MMLQSRTLASLIIAAGTLAVSISCTGETAQEKLQTQVAT